MHFYDLRDCAIIIRRGAEKTRGGHYINKIAAKMGGGSKLNQSFDGGGT